MVDGGMAIPSREVRPGVVTALVVIVLHIQTGQLGEVNAQSAASIVDVLSIQRLQEYITHYTGKQPATTEGNQLLIPVTPMPTTETEKLKL